MKVGMKVGFCGQHFRLGGLRRLGCLASLAAALLANAGAQMPAPGQIPTPGQIAAAKAAAAKAAAAARAGSGTGRTSTAKAAKNPAAAQPAATGPHLTAGPTYTSSDGKKDPEFPNVDVVYTLVGADGKPIAANPGDLKLFSQGTELGTATSIHTFAETGHGLTAILALDASGSMRGAPLNAIHATISKFVKQARSQDQVAVVTFADETKVDVPFGAGQDALTRELETVEPRGKQTRLYDGILDALKLFNNSQPKRRQLVVISDGHDEGSTHALADVVLRANQLNVVIDALGLTKDSGAFLSSLEQMSADTGGSYRRAMSAQDLDKFIDEGIQANQRTPVASFKTAHLAADNTVHAAQLRWKPGSLSAPAFISTPPRTLFRNPLLWVLGGCFVAGVVLLAVSWFGSKSGSKSGPKAAPAGGAAAVYQPPVPPPVPASYTPSPVVSRKTPTSFEGSPAPIGRTPTMPDSPPVSGGYTAPRPSNPAAPNQAPVFRSPTPGVPVIPAPAENVAAAKDILGRERSRTQLAAFFDAPEQGPYALIRVQTGDLAGMAIPMNSAIFSLGALAGNSLILPGDATVSGRHLRLLWEGSILKAEDLNSTNGTFLNAEKLVPGRHLLRPGDELRLGQTVMVLDRV